MMDSYQNTNKEKAFIHICILETSRDVHKMPFTWMEFFQMVDLSNYIASHIQYFHSKEIYNTIMTPILKYEATMDMTYRQINRYFSSSR